MTKEEILEGIKGLTALELSELVHDRRFSSLAGSRSMVYSCLPRELKQSIPSSTFAAVSLGLRSPNMITPFLVMYAPLNRAAIPKVIAQSVRNSCRLRSRSYFSRYSLKSFSVANCSVAGGIGVTSQLRYSLWYF